MGISRMRSGKNRHTSSDEVIEEAAFEKHVQVRSTFLAPDSKRRKISPTALWGCDAWKILWKLLGLLWPRLQDRPDSRIVKMYESNSTFNYQIDSIAEIRIYSLPSDLEMIFPQHSSRFIKFFLTWFPLSSFCPFPKIETKFGFQFYSTCHLFIENNTDSNW